MRRPSIFTDRRGPLDVKMTPMIDVVFLLLIFFVWSASFEIVEHLLPSHIAELIGSEPTDSTQTPPPEADFDDVVVRLIQAAGKTTWRVNDTPMANLAQVRAQLDSIAKIKNDAPVILHPDPQVPLGAVIDVYDISRIVGFEKVSFVASSGE